MSGTREAIAGAPVVEFPARDAGNGAPIPPELSDESLALRFSGRHGDELRYVAKFGRWYRWTGVLWQEDETLGTLDLSRAICREAASEAESTPAGRKVASASTVAAVERLARADRRHAATADQWDTDGWLLNTPGEVVDLRNGTARGHRRADYMTKVTAVSPNGDCPLWLGFLERVTDGNTELCGFLQRVAGYALTGSTREQALFFAYGTGANGKSVFLNTLARVLGTYATSAPMETFTASNTDRHPTDLAGLRGARLVTATETDEGRHWSESRLKALTGGDTIAARFMRQDFFEFIPQFKLLIAGNHKPSLRSVDEAIRRRLHLIPFTVTIPPEERDLALAEKLSDEWPGILRWMIDGCLAWQETGLAPPDIVRSATSEYLEEEDAFSQWLGECCDVRTDDYATTSALFTSWKQWAEDRGEYVGSQKRLAQNLQARGFAAKRQAGTGKAGFEGLRVHVQEGPNAYWNL